MYAVMLKSILLQAALLSGQTLDISLCTPTTNHICFRSKIRKASPRQLRHLDFIGQFTTDLRHIAGDENIVADTLSRINVISRKFKKMIVSYRHYYHQLTHRFN